MMPQNLSVKREAWHNLMTVFGLPKNDNTYDDLIKAYSEKHRAYHTLEHIEACFRHLDNVAAQAIHPHEIELALWFHDIVYKPFSTTNEEDSANLAQSFLSNKAIPPATSDRIYDLIILTIDHAEPRTQDAKLMLDIDLSILGAKADIYAKFETDIRQEYKRVPKLIFKKKRKEILEKFLMRPHIYHTEYFFERLETQARQNLTWAINAL